jgi:hypothetical protein
MHAESARPASPPMKRFEFESDNVEERKWGYEYA